MPKNPHNFREDPSGLWHHWSGDTTDIQVAAAEACRHLNGRAAWFWWQNTFAPILPDDTPEALLRRWEDWRAEGETDPTMVLRNLFAWMRKGTLAYT